MKSDVDISTIKYRIADPNHNITLLVETEVEVSRQKDIAISLMKKEKDVEQVGYIYRDGQGDIALRMAGGEFCGNATMSVAAYHLEKRKETTGIVKVHIMDDDTIIDVKANLDDKGIWETEETLYSNKIERKNFDTYNRLPIVFFDSISHIIIEEKALIKDLCESKKAEDLIKKWAREIDTRALGIMFYDREDSKLTPLVYVKDIETLFWERSCASGTVATGLYIAYNIKDTIDETFVEPGGILRVKADPTGKAILYGKVKYIK